MEAGSEMVRLDLALTASASRRDALVQLHPWVLTMLAVARAGVADWVASFSVFAASVPLLLRVAASSVLLSKHPMVIAQGGVQTRIHATSVHSVLIWAIFLVLLVSQKGVLVLAGVVAVLAETAPLVKNVGAMALANLSERTAIQRQFLLSLLLTMGAVVVVTLVRGPV